MKRVVRKNDAKARVKPSIRRDDIVYVLVKAIRPDPQIAQSGGFVRREGPIALSNLQLFCPNCQKPTRITRKVSGDRKERVCKRCNNPIGKA